jgi:hypothetical protein
MKFIAACLASLFLVPAMAQTRKPEVQDPAVERAKKNCEANHGVDCSSREGLREWLIQDRPMTVDQQRAAAAARRLREQPRPSSP